MNKRSKVVIVFLLIVLIVENVWLLSTVRHQPCEMMAPNESLYGDWEITDIIPGGRFPNISVGEKMIGTIVSLDENYIAVNGNICMNYPLYITESIKTDKRFSFCGNFIPINDEDVFDLNKPYFIHVTTDYTIENFDFSFGQYLWVCDFFMKSDSELVFNGISNGITNLYHAIRVEGK